MAERVQISYNPRTKLHTEYRRALATQEEIAYREDFNARRRNHTLSDEELSKEKRRQRGSHVANDIKNLLIAHEFKYFCTFTSDILANDARALLKAVQQYLAEQNTPFLCILEAFYHESDGFHVHAFTDKKINFEDWFRKYGGIRVDSKSTEELEDLFGDISTNIDGVEVNLYSEKIEDYPKTRSYSIKKISITKDRLPLYTPIYKHNLTNDDNVPNVKIDAIIDDNGAMILNHVNEIGEYLIRKNEAISNGINERDFILEELSSIRRLKIRYIFTNRNFPKSKMDLLRFINQDLEKYNNNTSNIDINDNFNTNISNINNIPYITNVENTNNVPNIVAPLSA